MTRTIAFRGMVCSSISGKIWGGPLIVFPTVPKLLGINQDLPSMHPKHVADLVQIPMFVIAIKYKNFGAWIVPAFVGGNPYLTISAAFTAQAERKSGLF